MSGFESSKLKGDGREDGSGFNVDDEVAVTSGEIDSRGGGCILPMSGFESSRLKGAGREDGSGFNVDDEVAGTSGEIRLS
jgi:hypothetical protein